jgi:hypothetical protein
MGIYGQDWASYQSATPDTSGLSFAFVKITEGRSYVNPEWVAQRDHAKANGLVWGGYHYPHMGNSPQAEADYFLSQVAWQPGDLVVLDWEGYDPANAGVSKATQAAYKDAWLRYVKGRLPHNPVGMYANVDYWHNVDQDGYYGDFLWIATAGRAAGDPGIQADWLFHQYSDSGVDRDFCHLSSTADLRSWAFSFASEADMLTPDDIAAIAAAVWSHTEKPGAGAAVRTGAALTWMDSVHAGQNARLDGLSKQLGALSATGLTDAQVQAIAAAIAANPDLVTAIAAAVAANLATRLES